MNKKTIIIVSISIIAVLIIVGLIWFFVANQNQDNSENKAENEVQQLPAEQSKTQKIYDELKNSEAYQFLRKVDDDNQVLIAQKANNAYEEEIFNGKKTTYLTKEGNLYFLNSQTDSYYVYQNNDEILHLIEIAFSKIENNTYAEGKEEINGEQYNYEEFQGIQDFLIDSNLYSQDETKVKTRFYYEGNDLKYIKTITADNEELLEIKINFEVDDSLFEIPEGYTNGENS